MESSVFTCFHSSVFICNKDMAHHATLVLDTLRSPCDQEEYCHLEDMVSSPHLTLSVLGKP